MKKTLLILGGAMFLGHGTVMAQRSCGIDQAKAMIIAHHPEFKAKMDAQLASLQADAEAYMASTANTAEKTTTVSPIPVIFHVIVSAAQLTEIGGTAGIQRRCDSQIAVLNRDYNRHNYDSTLIPSSWKPLFGNPGISFGLAHTDPASHGTPGYELLTASTAYVMNSNGDYADAKTAGTGLAGWDVTKYLNVWCIYFSDNTNLLGITTPPGFTVSAGGPIPDSHRGVCIAYNALGKRVLPTDSYPTGAGSPYDKGRTLTHEIGHYFDLRHTWGDDPSTSDCPWNGGSDDGIADTPPESQATYGAPTYTITGGTVYDGCKLNGTTNMQPIGIACLDYMDYTDDGAMHMFTTMQAALMSSKAITASGESHSLTQNPVLLQYPASVTNVEINYNVNVFPNPSTGMVTVSYNETADQLRQVIVTNILGQEVTTVKGQQKNDLSIDLSGMSKGIYFVKCNFAGGSVTRKILLQ